MTPHIRGLAARVADLHNRHARCADRARRVAEIEKAAVLVIVESRGRTGWKGVPVDEGQVLRVANARVDLDEVRRATKACEEEFAEIEQALCIAEAELDSAILLARVDAGQAL